MVPTATNLSIASVCAGDGEHSGRLSVTGKDNWVVPVPCNSTRDLPPVRDAGHRPVRLQDDSPITEVHVTGQTGPPLICSGRPEPTMDVSTAVRLPTTDAGADSGEQAEGSAMQDAADCAMLEWRTMATDAAGDAVRSATPHSTDADALDQHSDRVPGEQLGEPTTHSMAVMRQATGCDMQPTTFAILENSWRRGTRWQYQNVFSSWAKWCSSKCVDPSTVSVNTLLGYLQSLYDKGFAWRTINLHRSAISGILEPHVPRPIGQHPLVCRFVKGFFNERPPPVRVVPTWDVGQVFHLLSQWHPASTIPLPELTWKMVFLLAMCTARRVSDLLLFLWPVLCAM